MERGGVVRKILSSDISSPRSELQSICLVTKSSTLSRKVSGPTVGTVGLAVTPV